MAEVDSILNRSTNALLAVGLDPQPQRVAAMTDPSLMPAARFSPAIGRHRVEAVAVLG
jgi:hypothetical protein